METDDREEEKMRRCIYCQKQFKSKNAANRYCSKCKNIIRDVTRRSTPITPAEQDIQEDPLI